MKATSATALTTARTACGLTQLCGPTDRPGADSRALLVKRLLGARQITQALVCAVRPTTAVLRLGAAVDIVHGTSMVALAAGSQRYRRPALVEAGTAFALALGGHHLARRASQ